MHKTVLLSVPVLLSILVIILVAVKKPFDGFSAMLLALAILVIGLARLVDLYNIEQDNLRVDESLRTINKGYNETPPTKGTTMNRLEILNSSLQINQEFETLLGKLQKERQRIVDLIKEDQNPSFDAYDRLKEELYDNRYEFHGLFGIAAKEDGATKPTLWQRLTKK